MAFGGDNRQSLQTTDLTHRQREAVVLYRERSCDRHITEIGYAVLLASAVVLLYRINSKFFYGTAPQRNVTPPVHGAYDKPGSKRHDHPPPPPPMIATLPFVGYTGPTVAISGVRIDGERKIPQDKPSPSSPIPLSRSFSLVL